MADIFPVEYFDNIRQHPENYLLLQKIPLTIEGVDSRFPIRLQEEEAGERVTTVVFLDTETTGLNHDLDKIIELGLVKVKISLDRKIILTVEKFYNALEDPKCHIPERITEITHITDDMVAGQSLDDDAVASFLAGRPLIVAHNAGFDRPFFDKRFPSLSNLSWACSLKEIPWEKFGYNCSKLEFLNLKLGWFYEAHRAYVDCLALLWLLYIKPEAFGYLLDNAQKKTYKIIIRGNTYSISSDLKRLGYRFGQFGKEKYWYSFELSEQKAQERIDVLKQTLKYGKVDFTEEIKELSAKERFKL